MGGWAAGAPCSTFRIDLWGQIDGQEDSRPDRKCKRGEAKIKNKVLPKTTK